MINLIPPENYKILFLTNILHNIYFRVIKNEKTGMVYPEYTSGKTWKILSQELVCKPVHDNEEPLTDEEITELYGKQEKEICLVVLMKVSRSSLDR